MCKYVFIIRLSQRSPGVRVQRKGRSEIQSWLTERKNLGKHRQALCVSLSTSILKCWYKGVRMHETSILFCYTISFVDCLPIRQETLRAVYGYLRSVFSRRALIFESFSSLASILTRTDGISGFLSSRWYLKIARFARRHVCINILQYTFLT